MPVSVSPCHETGPTLVWIQWSLDSLSRSTGLELVFCRFSILVQVILLVSLGVLSYEEHLRTISRSQGLSGELYPGTRPVPEFVSDLYRHSRLRYILSIAPGQI